MPDVKFITRNGLKSARKAANHEIDGFMEFVFFSEDVLKKYESNRDYTVGDNGTVTFGDKWGLFRGIYRVAKGYLGVHLGDLGEGLPDEELRHWKNYNVHPDKIPKAERYFDFRSTIKRMIYSMKLLNDLTKHYLDRIYFDVKTEEKYVFNLNKVEQSSNTLKKIINDKTTCDEFQSRIIFLNIFLIESINTKLILAFFDKVDPNWKYSMEKLELREILEKYMNRKTPDNFKETLSKEIEPLKSLELLKRFLLLLQLSSEIINRYKIKNLKTLKSNRKRVYKRIAKEFKHYYHFHAYGKSFSNQKYFDYYENKINEDTSFLKLLNRFRNSSAAHGFSNSEYENLVKILTGTTKSEDYSLIYEKLILSVSYDIERLYSLMARVPPIFEYYEEYTDDCLLKLTREQRYESIFEDLASYLYDFPELFPHIKIELSRIYSKKKGETNFIIALGCFVESISYSVKDRSQSLIDFIVEGYPYDKALTLAHISHIIKNSKKLSPRFFSKIDKLIEKAATADKHNVNVDFALQHLIFCLIEKFPEKLNKERIKSLLNGRKITWDKIKSYLRGT